MLELVVNKVPQYHIIMMVMLPQQHQIHLVVIKDWLYYNHQFHNLRLPQYHHTQQCYQALDIILQVSILFPQKKMKETNLLKNKSDASCSSFILCLKLFWLSFFLFYLPNFWYCFCGDFKNHEVELYISHYNNTII